MLPEISEFSYGFALTNELVGWTELSAAPVFPSLIEEGRAGGGYDVKLDRPGAPLYLQFKRSERMERRSAREYREVRNHGGYLNVPFYRFNVTEATKSAQHELLLALDTDPNLVFYAAPRFHRIDEINDAWRANAVASRSLFVAPAEIGSLDMHRHSVAFDGRNRWICSEPRSLRGLSSRDVVEKIQNALRTDDRSLRERLPEFAESLRSAEVRGRERIHEKQREMERRQREQRAIRIRDLTGDALPTLSLSRGVTSPVPERPLVPDVPARTVEAPEPTPPDTRAPKDLSPELRALREASDVAARVFDAQLVIVQPRSPST